MSTKPTSPHHLNPKGMLPMTSSSEINWIRAADLIGR